MISIIESDPPNGQSQYDRLLPFKEVLLSSYAFYEDTGTEKWYQVEADDKHPLEGLVSDVRRAASQLDGVGVTVRTEGNLVKFAARTQRKYSRRV